MPVVSNVSHTHKTSDPVLDREFDSFLAAFTRNFSELTKGDCTLVQTDATGLFDSFLRNLPSDQRQHYECRECRKFVDKFGGLRVLTSTGSEHTIWDFPVPASFAYSVQALKTKVSKAKISTAFVSPGSQWGIKRNLVESGPWTGTTWTHLNITPPGKLTWYSRTKNADQRAAELKEDFGMLSRALDEFSLASARQAAHLLTNGDLYRASKADHIAIWFRDLHESLVGIPRNHRRRDNIIWYAAQTAPVGYAHVKSSMIGTLLEDIQAGLTYPYIKAAWDKKMDPLKYMRPKAAPKAGTLVQASKLVDELDSAGAFKRRFAQLGDVVGRAIWLPGPHRRISSGDLGIFSDIKPKATPSTLMPIPGTTTMTWVKFRDTVLPNASSVEFNVPGGNHNFVGVLTAENMSAPPILKWDSETNRNPVSLYLYSGGSVARDWGLIAGTRVQVDAVMTRPEEWTSDYRTDAGIIFVLRSARDKRGPGLALFPETLKSEYHGVRSAIEALNKTRRPTGIGSANGIFFSEKSGNGNWASAKFTVTDRQGNVRAYQLDRWD